MILDAVINYDVPEDRLRYEVLPEEGGLCLIPSGAAGRRILYEVDSCEDDMVGTMSELLNDLFEAIAAHLPPPG